MTPNFSLLRKLHARIAAMPEELITLDFYERDSIDAGIPRCVLGHLLSMPEANAVGLTWDAFHETTLADYIEMPALLGSKIGLDSLASNRLFGPRSLHLMSQKQEALERIELLFLQYGICLFAPVAQPEDASALRSDCCGFEPRSGHQQLEPWTSTLTPQHNTMMCLLAPPSAITPLAILELTGS